MSGSVSLLRSRDLGEWVSEFVAEQGPGWVRDKSAA